MAHALFLTNGHESFYSSLQSADITPEDYVGQFLSEHEQNRTVLSNKRFDVGAAKVELVLETIEHVMSTECAMISIRAIGGFVVEGHGDLRPEHICLTDPPAIIDCLEFNRSLRIVDPFGEISFLGMECERFGAPWIREALISRCAELLGDSPSDRLLAFYTAYRACLRARLALAHLLEPEIHHPEKWQPMAKTYLDIAERACLKLSPQGNRPESHPRGADG